MKEYVPAVLSKSTQIITFLGKQVFAKSRATATALSKDLPN